MRSTRLLSSLSLTLLVLSGCGDDGTTVDSSTADSAIVDATPDGVETPDGGDTPDGGARYGGQVTVYARIQATSTNVIGAHFAVGLAPEDPCADATETAGDCCYLPPVSGPPPEPPDGVSAGPILLRDETSGTDIVGLDFSSDFGTYPMFQWTTPFWSPGDTLVASAPGDVVGAFSLSVLAPAPLAGISPDWTAGHSIPLGVDFTIGWEPDAAGQTIDLVMDAQSPDGIEWRGGIACRVADSAGSLTVAQSLLSHFAAGDICYSCGLFRRVRGTDSAGNADLWFDVHMVSTGDVTFE